MEDNCEICSWIKQLQKREEFLIKELSTGYVVSSRYQHKYYEGYSLFLCKIHKTDLHELDREFRTQFLKEMSLVAEAVYKTFKPDKLNYELLGNSNPHLHWHLIPRYKKDANFTRTIWTVDKQIRQAVSTQISEKEAIAMKEKIAKYL